MNRLTLKYFKRGVETENKSKSNKQFGNVSLTENGIEKSNLNFFEFYIDEIPLSRRLDEFYNNKLPLIDNWVGMLGAFENKEAEKVKIKQLLLKDIKKEDLSNVFPKTLDKRELENCIENYKEELADEEVIVYGCAECGDYQCGGYGVKIDKDNDCFIWKFKNDKETLQFKFNKYEYYEELDKYLKRINKND